MALIDRVKANLGIVHTSLDTELTSEISEARAELVRLGVPRETAYAEDNVLIDSAVIAYVCYKRTIGADENDGWHRAWDYQSDCIRKTKWL